MELKEKIVSVVFALLLCAMVYSTFIRSMCMMSLVVLAFLDFNTTSRGTKISFTWRPFIRLRAWSKYSHFLIIALFFFIVLFSYWQVEGDNSYFLERLRIKVPFLLLPLAYLGLPKLSKLTFHRILYFFMALMTISVLGVLTAYATNYEAVNLLLKQGQHMAVPCNHIRFSILVGLSILAGWYLIKEGFGSKGSSTHRIVKILTLVLFISIHILSVKTGIVCLYVALVVLTVRHVYTTRNLKIGVGLFALLILLPMIAYKTVPSFNRKVHYTMYDLQMYTQGQGSNYGDSGRITSLKVAYDIFKDSPIFGVGAGNLKREVSNEFKINHPSYSNVLMPHNQFMFVLAGSGIFGFILFLLALFIPILYRGAFRNDFYLGFYMMFLTSFIIEHTLENALGASMFSSFLILCALYVQRDEDLEKIA